MHACTQSEKAHVPASLLSAPRRPLAAQELKPGQSSDVNSTKDLAEAFKLLNPDSQDFITSKQMALICKQLGEDMDEDEVCERERESCGQRPRWRPCPRPWRPPLPSLSCPQVDDMVSEAILGYQGDIYYDGLLKILITS